MKRKKYNAYTDVAEEGSSRLVDRSQRIGRSIADQNTCPKLKNSLSPSELTPISSRTTKWVR
jgi:hypothetical protein